MVPDIKNLKFKKLDLMLQNLEKYGLFETLFIFGQNANRKNDTPFNVVLKSVYQFSKRHLHYSIVKKW